MAARHLPATLVAVWILCAGMRVNGAKYGPPSPALVSKEPPVKGNVLRNSSFELGWHGIWGDTHQARPRQCIDDLVAYHGKQSVRISAGGGRPVVLAGQFVPIKPFHLYTVSAFVKASTPGVRVEISARSGYVGDDKAPPYAIRQTRQIGRKWQRISATGAFGRTPGSACSVSVRVLPSGQNADVWVDAIQLEEGRLGRYAPAHPVEVALATDRPADAFFDDQPRKIELRLVNYSRRPQRARYRLRVRDFWNEGLFRKPIREKLAPGERKTLAIVLPESLRGSLRVQALREPDGGLGAELIVSVLPRPLRTDLWPESTIGNHLGTNEYVLKVGQMLGIHWSRDHDASDIGHWNVREPERGKFVWADEEVDRIRRYGIELLPCLEQVPPWQGKSPWSFPRSLAAWRRYVRKTVEHYRGRVRYWYIWNEGWGVTGEQYGRLVTEAYNAAHTADPDARIVFEYSTWQGVSYLEAAKSAGAAEHTDIIATHLVTGNQWRLPDEPGRGWTLSYNIARLLSEYGTMAQGRPLWMTEGGLFHDAWKSDIILDAVDTPYSRVGSPEVACEPWMTAEDATRFIPRYYVTWRACGGDKWFYYWSPYVPAPDNPNSFVFFECDGSLHPMAVANAVMARQLDGSCFVRTIDFGDVNLKCHVFEQFGEGVAVLWWQGGGVRRVSLPNLQAGARRVDMMGNPSLLGEAPILALTGDPIYVRKSGISGERLADMLQP